MSSPSGIPERRNGYRIQLHLPIQVEIQAARWIEGETLDVGTGGFLLHLPEYLPAGRTIEYIVCVPDFRSVRLRCVGKVLRSSRLDNDGVATAVTMEQCLSVHSDHPAS